MLKIDSLCVYEIWEFNKNLYDYVWISYIVLEKVHIYIYESHSVVNAVGIWSHESLLWKVSGSVFLVSLKSWIYDYCIIFGEYFLN